VTLKPAVFIDTTPKIHNPEYTKLDIEPLEFTLRGKVGIRIDPKDLSGLSDRIGELLESGNAYREQILSIRESIIANFGRSGEVGGRYILDALKARKKTKQPQ
jgi:YidC/Oxa1 family membrane protein insertase